MPGVVDPAVTVTEVRPVGSGKSRGMFRPCHRRNILFDIKHGNFYRQSFYDLENVSKARHFETDGFLQREAPALEDP